MHAWCFGKGSIQTAYEAGPDTHARTHPHTHTHTHTHTPFYPSKIYDYIRAQHLVNVCGYFCKCVRVCSTLPLASVLQHNTHTHTHTGDRVLFVDAMLSSCLFGIRERSLSSGSKPCGHYHSLPSYSRLSSDLGTSERSARHLSGGTRRGPKRPFCWRAAENLDRSQFASRPDHVP